MKNSTKWRGARRKRPAPFNIADELRVFGFKAYSAALDFYARHHDDPAALAAYVEAAGVSFNLPADRNSNEALAHHQSEAIRIVEDRDDLPASLLRDLGGALNNFLNDLPSLADFHQSEACILLTLETYIKQTKEGASR